MTSKLFADGYISIGARTRACHTDYRNPAITHLFTRSLHPYENQHNSGQTVLFDRYATKAIVVSDSSTGRQLMGGLNWVKHANMGPQGDVY